MGAEMDCCDSTDEGRRFYVELKTSCELERRTEERYEREKLLKFWIQSFLAGMPYIVIGFREESAWHLLMKCYAGFMERSKKGKKMARKFFVGGNWKCNGTTEEVKKIVTTLNEAEVPSEDVVDVVVSPPFVFLSLVKSLLRPDFHVAAQNCWVRKGGAFTGEVSAEMLVNLAIPWVIIGHSERRLILNESNEFVGDKVAYALSLGLKVIACVGETLEQRESGSTLDVVSAQTKAIADKIINWDNVVLAYEPVWAIGTGKVATPAQAQEVHVELRKWLHDNIGAEVAATTRIIYGGSVNGANSKELAAQPDLDGFLVGGASLKPEFVDIIKSATVKKNA